MSPAKLTAICAFVMLMPLLRYIRQIQTDKDTDTDTTAVTVASLPPPLPPPLTVITILLAC